MTDLLAKARKINTPLQQGNTFDMQADLPYDKMAVTLDGILDNNTYIIGSDGVLLGYNEHHDADNERIKTILVEKQFPEPYTDAVAQLMRIEANIPVTNDVIAFPVESREKYPFGLTAVAPISGADEYLGTIILSCIEQSFAGNDLVLAEYGATVAGVRILYQKFRSTETDIRSATTIQVAINALFYNELKAVQTTFEALDGGEGRLTVSNITDSIGVTRPVIVDVLRKLESAGIIESRPLGVEGIYLRVLNSHSRGESAEHSY